jgi:hypothetical protein
MTVCGLPIQVGEIELTADGLTDLAIDCASGFAATELQVGFPAPRPVVRARALGDGVLDDSLYFGNRAITLSIRLDTSISPPQPLVDQLLPFLAQSRRPRLAWRMGDTPYPPAPPAPIPVPFSDGRWRSAIVRGTDAPLVISGPRYWTIVLSFVTVDAYLETRELSPWAIGPNAATTTVWHQGNAPAPWVLTFTGNAITPQFIVNGVSISFPAYTAAVTKQVTIDLAARTMIETNIVGAPSPVNVYPQSNSYSWSWSSLYLQPGANTIQYNTGLPSPPNNAQLNFRDTWL